MKRLDNSYKDLELSNATLLNSDLIPAFLSFLQDVKVKCDAVEEVDAIQAEVDELHQFNTETGDYIVNEDLFNLLNEIAPECCYFGSHEGDGSCFGFWFAQEELELIVSNGEEAINYDSRDD